MPDEEQRTAPIVRDGDLDLRSQIDKLSGENLVLKQHIEFTELFARNEKAYAEEFSKHKEHVTSEITRRMVAMTLVGLAALGVAWYQTITPVRKDVQERLNKEFASDNIRELISNAAEKAAQGQAKELIDERITPATTKALEDIQEHRNEVSMISQQVKSDTSRMVENLQQQVSQQGDQEKTALESLRKEYAKEVGDLNALVSYQEKLKDIQLLKSNAMIGDVPSWEKLETYPADDTALREAATSAVIEVKEPYVFGERVRGVDIWLNNSDGTHGPTNDAIPTTALIGTFLLSNNQRWEFRTRAAQILASRRESAVPPVLLSAMQNDNNLWVRRAALLSFQQLTGFQPNDVFGWQEAADWWAKNKDNYLNSLPKK
jgi:hypothetical protein